jgi:hypothetical protein
LPNEKPSEEVLMHFGAGLIPIKVVTISHFLSPKPIIVRGSRERREDMVTLTASQNVNAILVENGTVPQASTQQTLYGLLFPVYGTYHILFPYFTKKTRMI